MLNDNVSVRGDLTISLISGETGEVYFTKEEKNLVVLVGRAWMASRLKDTDIPAQMTHMELGQGTTSPVAADTGIQTAFTPEARVALSTAGGTVSSNTVTYAATFPAGVGTGNVTEAGIFNAATGGTMLCRTTFGVVTKPAGDQLAINWTLTILG